jgi:hypothetical protein
VKDNPYTSINPEGVELNVPPCHKAAPSSDDMNINYDDITFDMISKAYYRGRKKSLKCGIVANKRMMIGHLFFII